MTSTPDAVSEYDRFGPWIDEVRTPDDLPRLYREHPIDFDSARLVLKVPRNVARRDATPDMDLYDHVLVVGDDHLTVLSRRPDPGDRPGTGPGRYDVQEVPLATVAAVRDVVNLLDGALTISLRDGSVVTVRYNGSARENVQRLVDLLRTATASAVPSPAGLALFDAGSARAAAGATIDAGREDSALISDVRDVTRHLPALTPWAAHGRRRVKPAAAGLAGVTRSVLNVLSPATLHGAVLAGDPRAFEVFGRHEWLLRGGKPVHSASRLVVPLNAVDRLRLVPHAVYAGVAVAELDLGATTVSVVVPEGVDAHALFVDAFERHTRTGE